MDCTRCKAHLNTLNVCVPGEGEPGGLMLVGTSPDLVEDENGDIYTDEANMFLRDDILPVAGVSEGDVPVWFTYAVRCVNNSPGIRDIIQCYDHLEAEIDRVKPRVIGVMGNVALASVLWFAYKKADKKNAKVSGIMKWRGKAIWHKRFNCWVVPTLSPTYAYNRLLEGYRYEKQLMIDDCKLMNKYLHVDAPKVDPVPRVVESDSEIDEMLTVCEETDVFAYDTETGGTTDKYIIGISLAVNSQEGYYCEYSRLEQSKYFKRYLKLLRDPKKLKVMHNGAFDIRVHNFSGVPIFYQRYWDTMIGAQMMDENFPLNLKDLSWRYTYFGGYDLELDQYKKAHGIKEDYSKIPYELLSKYGAYDAIATYRLYEIQLKELDRLGELPLFKKITMPARAVACKAEYNGLRVDIDWVNYLVDTGKKVMAKLEDRIFNEVGHQFNLNSNKDKQHVLFDELKLKPLKKTKTRYSVDSETIAYCADQRNGQVARYIADREYIKTMIGTHAKQAFELCGEDGRVHTHFNFTGTVTGRISASAPSLQNVPNDGFLRSMYIPSEGRVLIEADLKSAELAYLSAVSGENVFLQAFEEGTDLHALTYNTVMGLPLDNVPSKEERQLAKRVNFGLVYGISAYGLAKMLGMSVEEVEDFMYRYFAKLPRIKKYLEDSDRFVTTHGYVKSIFNRVRHLPEALSDDEGVVARACRQAKNAPIQSGASDYTQNGIVRTDRRMRKMGARSQIVHTVHDCVIIDAVPDEVDALKSIIAESFEAPLKILPVRMRIDIEVLNRWGEGNSSKIQELFEAEGFKVGR